MAKKMHCEIENITNLLKHNFIQVPPNQRKFEWEEQQASELLDDIENESGGIFLGTIITLNENQDDISNKDLLQIVDGQQRLTTISIMLIAIRNKFISLGIEGESRSDSIRGDVQRLITHREGGSKVENPILRTSNSIEKVYEQACDKDWQNEEFLKPDDVHGSTWNSNVARFNKAYKALSAKIKDYDYDKTEKLFYKIEKARVAHIDVENLVDALELFERTNARGKALSVNDLVKNHLFIKESETGYQEYWEDIENNSGKSIVQCLRYFQISKNGMTPTKDLYSEIKKTIEKESVIEFIQELKIFSTFYSLLTDDKSNDYETFFKTMNLGLDPRLIENQERLSFGLQALKLMKIKQAIPLIYSALRVASKIEVNNKEDKKKKDKAVENTIRLVEILERFHFSYSAICSLRANAVENLYASYAKRITNENKVGPSYSDLKSKEFQKEHLVPKFEDFKENFVNLSYKGDSLLIRYAFDKMINFNTRYWDNRVKIFISNKNLTEPPSYNIEHIYPKKIVDDYLKLVGKDVLDNIGNLWTLYVKENSGDDFSNKAPEEKIKNMRKNINEKGNSSSYIQLFLELHGEQDDKWSEEIIDHRALQMAKLCYEKAFNLKEDPAHWTKT